MSLKIIDPRDPDPIPGLPNQLYKFRLWKDQTHKDVLEKQVLFFSTPKKLWEVGDDKDCQFPIEVPFTYSEYRSIFDATPTRPDWTNLPPDELERKLHDLAIYRLTPYGKLEFIQLFLDDQSDELAVLSMTERYDNSKMWQSSYSNFVNGFCVTIDPHQCNLPWNNITGGSCSYVPVIEPPMPYKAPSIHGETAAVEMKINHLFKKYDRFSFEEEYRLIKHFPRQIYEGGFTIPDQCFQVPKAAIQEVTVGYLMSQKHIDEIIDTCRTQGLKVNIFKAGPYNGPVFRQHVTST